MGRVDGPDKLTGRTRCVAAIANAFAQLTDVCPTRHPIVAEDVLAALRT